jgi:hypothetical protein
MKIVNLTPHPLTVHDANGQPVTFPKAANPARVAMDTTQVGLVGAVGVQLFKSIRTEFGAVEGLPEPDGETFYIVSALVFAAAPNRYDLIVPADQQRDGAGRVTHALAFQVR